jgi:hypothetical protein
VVHPYTPNAIGKHSSTIFFTPDIEISKPSHKLSHRHGENLTDCFVQTVRQPIHTQQIRVL